MASQESPPQKHISSKLRKLSYSGYEEEATDQRTPSLAPEQVLLTDSYISQNNLTPEKVRDILRHGSIVVLYRSYRDQLPLILLFILSLTFVSTVSILYPTASPIGFPVQIFGPLVLLAFIAHRRWNGKYFIQKDGVVIVRGLLLIKLSRLKCEYDKVKGLEVVKNILQRILNVGDLRISTAMFDAPEIGLQGISNPYFYSALIALLIEDQTGAAQTPPPV